jgi:GT2 family glycosyltransferase
LPVVSGIVVVDDRSTDGFVPTTTFDRLLWLKNTGRRGFAATVNVGLRNLFQRGPPDFVAVANNDLVFDALLGRAIEVGLAFLEGHPGVGLCGFRELAKASDLPSDSHSIGGSAIAHVVPGCLMLFRSSVFQRLGYFSEGYFMYGEENDYFDRMHRNGIQLALVDLPVVHEGEGSRLPGLRTSWLAHRNALRRAIKALSLRMVVRTMASLVLMPWLRRMDTAKHDPSLARTLRFGRLAGSLLGVSSVLWNLVHLPETVRERLAEDAFISAQWAEDPGATGGVGTDA